MIYVYCNKLRDLIKINHHYWEQFKTVKVKRFRQMTHKEIDEFMKLNVK